MQGPYEPEAEDCCTAVDVGVEAVGEVVGTVGIEAVGVERVYTTGGSLLVEFENKAEHAAPELVGDDGLVVLGSERTTGLEACEFAASPVEVGIAAVGLSIHVICSSYRRWSECCSWGRQE